MQSYSIWFFFSLVCLDTIAQWHTTEVKKNVYISLELLNPSHKFWWYSWWYSHNMQCWYIFPLLLNQIILILNSFYFATPTGWTGFFGKKRSKPSISLAHNNMLLCVIIDVITNNLRSWKRGGWSVVKWPVHPQPCPYKYNCFSTFLIILLIFEGCKDGKYKG